MKVEQALKIEIDAEVFGAAYGHVSRTFPTKAGQKAAVRVVSQFGGRRRRCWEGSPGEKPA